MLDSEIKRYGWFAASRSDQRSIIGWNSCTYDVFIVADEHAGVFGHLSSVVKATLLS